MISDRRWKQNEKVISGALDKVKAIPAKTFNYISQPDRKLAGFISQDCLPYIPEVVTKMTGVNNEEIYTLSPEAVVPFAWNAIRELSLVVDTQATDIKNIKDTVNAMLKKSDPLGLWGIKPLT